MSNQIQVYRETTAFWLDKEWRTPKQRELEAANRRRREENEQLKAELKALREELGPLKPFKDIPCCRCGKPMGVWPRSVVLDAFKSWRHTSCGG